jgi:hypothetical protein
LESFMTLRSGPTAWGPPTSPSAYTALSRNTGGLVPQQYAHRLEGRPPSQRAQEEDRAGPLRGGCAGPLMLRRGRPALPGLASFPVATST